MLVSQGHSYKLLSVQSKQPVSNAGVACNPHTGQGTQHHPQLHMPRLPFMESARSDKVAISTVHAVPVYCWSCTLCRAGFLP